MKTNKKAERIVKTDADIREAMINAGIANLKEFGYPGVTAKNILTDTIYRAFFHNMLGNAENKEATRGRPAIEKVRADLWEETKF